MDELNTQKKQFQRMRRIRWQRQLSELRVNKWWWMADIPSRLMELMWNVVDEDGIRQLLA